MPQDKNNLIWIDLEMTGLDFRNDHIIEIATIITDPKLNILAEGPVIAIHQPSAVLDGMDDWNTKQHNQSGLVARVKESAHTVEEAEEITLQFMKEWTLPNCSPLCGNSICTDRRFLAKEMPEIDKHLHYRHIDVSTLKSLAAHWKPEAVFKKEASHLALQDIKDSIAELRHYREHLFHL